MEPLQTVELQVQIVRLVDDHFPGFVEARLVDALGKTWSFIEKSPVVCLEMWSLDGPYPHPGSITGTMVSTERDDRGREILLVDTETPWGIAATTGETRFCVLPEQIARTEEG